MDGIQRIEVSNVIIKDPQDHRTKKISDKVKNRFTSDLQKLTDPKMQEKALRVLIHETTRRRTEVGRPHVKASEKCINPESARVVKLAEELETLHGLARASHDSLKGRVTGSEHPIA